METLWNHVYDPHVLSENPMYGLDSAKGDIDIESRKVNAHIISLNQAYSNLGIALASHDECQISFSIMSFGAVTLGIFINT